MNVVFMPFDAQHYLMNLRLNMSGALQSDRMGDQYCLILRLPYQQDFNAITPQIFLNVLQNSVSELVNHCNTFVKVGENADLGLFLRTAVITGFQVMGVQNAASSYAMFSCEITMSQDTGEKLLVVYASPNGLFAAENICNVPAVVQVRVQRDVIYKHRKEKFTGYYVAEFFGSVELEQGNIWYNIPGSKVNYPVNGAMLRQKRIYIKSDFPPEFKSAGGVRVDLI